MLLHRFVPLQFPCCSTQLLQGFQVSSSSRTIYMQYCHADSVTKIQSHKITEIIHDKISRLLGLHDVSHKLRICTFMSSTSVRGRSIILSSCDNKDLTLIVLGKFRSSSISSGYVTSSIALASKSFRFYNNSST